MKRKSVLFIAAVAVSVAMTACQPISVNINIPESNNSNQVSEEPSIEVSEDPAVSEDPVASEDVSATSSNLDGATVEALEQFVVSNFLNYAALSYEYPEYSLSAFDDNAKCKLICFAELGREDAELSYSDEWQLMEIKKDRVTELAKELFDCEVNTYSCQDVMTNHEDVVKSDDDGNLLFNVGDWGTVGPIPADIVINGTDGTYEIKVDVAMYDYETSTEGETIGTYTVNVATRDNGSFYVTNFSLR